MEGGEETELWPGIKGVNCAPARQGVYCIQKANDRTTVNFLNMKTRSGKVLSVVPGPPQS